MDTTIGNKWTCTACSKELDVQDVFVLRQAGPVLSLRPLCEPCADRTLRIYQKERENA